MEPEPRYDIKGIPLHEFDIYRIEHFRAAHRRRICYMYKVARVVDGRWYGYDLGGVVLSQRANCHRYLIGESDKFEIIDGQIERGDDGSLELFWERKRRKQ